MNIKQIQEKLNLLGYNCGTPDGVFGPKSFAALRQFQQDMGLLVDGVPGPSTQAALITAEPPVKPRDQTALPPVMVQAQKMGHQIWIEPWRLWLYGIRSPGRTVNSFDDALGVCWNEGDGIWRSEIWSGTTDPGLKYMVEPLNSEGCAILVPGQYLDTWTIGIHYNYEALCQYGGEVSVFRDNNRDNKMDLDPATIISGYFGINIHASTLTPGATAGHVGGYSAGCQVHATEAGFSRMMELARLQIANNGRDRFSYTLLNQWW